MGHVMVQFASLKYMPQQATHYYYMQGSLLIAEQRAYPPHKFKHEGTHHLWHGFVDTCLFDALNFAGYFVVPPENGPFCALVGEQFLQPFGKCFKPFRHDGDRCHGDYVCHHAEHFTHLKIHPEGTILAQRPLECLVDTNNCACLAFHA